MALAMNPVDTVVLRVTVNGEPREITVPPDRRLIDLLRADLALTGTKEACSVGVCGVCSVLVDGKLVSACLVPAVRVDGTEITTVEGIGGPDGALSPVQQSFIRHGGFQCGICTPGQVVAATALLRENPSPEPDEVREWMTGNLCRCTGYYGIVASVLGAAGQPDDEEHRPPIETRDPATVGAAPPDGAPRAAPPGCARRRSTRRSRLSMSTVTRRICSPAGPPWRCSAGRG